VRRTRSSSSSRRNDVSFSRSAARRAAANVRASSSFGTPDPGSALPELELGDALVSVIAVRSGLGMRERREAGRRSRR
jgi:hypothetical protein